MPQPTFSALVEDSNYLADIGYGVWLMDHHRWALKVWETERKSDSYTLVHADFHWDAVYHFNFDPKKEAQLIAASPELIAELVAEGKWITYESFIAPAIRRGTIHTVHFFCLQDDGENGLDNSILAKCDFKQVFHSSAKSLAAAKITGPFIFDLCLDLFNRSDEAEVGDLWSDDDIRTFIETVSHLIRMAEMVTISMSFGYSGDSSDTQHLASLVVPEILAMRQPA